MRNMLSDICDWIAVSIPLLLFALHWLKPHLFKGFARIFSTVVIISVLSWTLVNLSLFLVPPDNGLASHAAFFLGWAYIWLLIIPAGVVYLLLRLFAILIFRLYRILFRL